MDNILAELVASSGDVRLASERAGVSVHQMTLQLLESPEIGDLIASSISLQMLDLVANLKIAIIASMDEMSPRDLSRTLVELLQTFNDLRTGEPSSRAPLTPIGGMRDDDSARSARDRLISQLAQLAHA